MTRSLYGRGKELRHHCYLCEGVSNNQPCIVDLSSGSIAELSSAAHGTATFTTVGSISLRSIGQEGVTANIPAQGNAINRSLYCENCLSAIDSTSNNGYLLADLSDLNSIALYEISDGMLLSLMDYSISVISDGTHSVIEAKTIN